MGLFFSALTALVVFVAALSVPAQEGAGPAGRSNLPNILSGHLAPLYSAVYAMDGGIVATASFDQTIKLFDASTGDELRTFDDHQNLVLSLAVSPDGFGLVSGAQDNTLRLWDLPTTAPVSSWAEHASGVRGLAVTADGELVLSAGEDATVRVWLRETGTVVETLGGHAGQVLSVAIRPDGDQWASGDASGRIRQWLPTVFLGEEPTEGLDLFAHTGPVTGLAYHVNNQMLYSTGADGTAKAWQLPVTPPRVIPVLASTAEVADDAGDEANAESQQDADGEDANGENSPDAPVLLPVRGMALSANGQLLIAGTAGNGEIGGQVRVYDADSGEQLRSLDGQPGDVLSLALSPNNALAVSGNESGTLKFWNVADGTDRFRVQGHAGAVRGVTFHPASEQVVSVGVDGTIRVWRLPVAPVLLSGHSDPAYALAVSPDGQFLVSVGDDRAVRVWNLTNGQAVRTQEGHEFPIGAVAYRPDNAQTATADDAGVIRLWNAADGQPQGTLGGHTAAITGLAFSPNNQVLASTAADGIVKLWRVPVTAPRTLAGHTDAVQAVAVSSDGQFAASGGADETVRLYSVADGSQVRQLAAEMGSVTSVDFNADNTLVAAGNADGVVQFRNVADGESRLRVAGHTGAVRAVKFHPDAAGGVGLDGGSVATAGDDGTVRWWRLPQVPTLLNGHTAAVEAAAVRHDGELIATGSGDNSVRLWNPLTGEAAGTLVGHQEAVLSMAFSRDAGQNAVGWLASGDTAGTIRFWNPAVADEEAPAGMFGAHGGAVRAVDFDANNRWLVSASDDGTVKVWRLPIVPPRSLAEHSAAVRSVAVSSDGRWVLTGGLDEAESVRLFDLSADDPQPVVLANAGGPVEAVAFSADHSRAAAANQSGVIEFWRLAAADAAMPESIGRLAGHDGAVLDLDFHPAAGRIVSAGEDGTVREWRLPTVPRTLRTDDAESTQVRSVGVRPDGSSVATGGADGLIRVYNPTGDVENGSELIGAWDTSGEAVTTVAFSLDGDLLAGGDEMGAVHLLNAADGEAVRRIIGHQGAITAIAFPPARSDALAGGLIATGSDDETIRLWSPPTAAEAVDAQGQTVEKLLASSDGKLLATSGMVGDRPGVLIRERESNTVLGTLLGHEGPITAMAFSADGTKFVTGSADGTARAWDLDDQKFPELLRFTGHGGAVTAVAFNGDATRVLSGADDEANTLKLWSTVTAADAEDAELAPAAEGEEISNLAGHADAIVDVAISPDGDLLFSASADGTVRVWNAADSEAVRTITIATGEGRPTSVVRMTLAADGSRLAVADAAHAVSLYNPADGELLATIAGHTAAVTSLAFNPAGTRLLSISEDGTTRISDGAGRLLEQFDAADRREAGAGRFTAAQFADDGPAAADPEAQAGQENSEAVRGQAVIVAVDGALEKFAPTLVRLIAAHEGGVSGLAFVSGGEQLASSGADGAVRLWSVDDGSAVRTLVETDEAIRSLALRPDGAQLAAGGTDNVLRLLSLADEAAEPKTISTTGAVNAVTYSADGSRMAISTTEADLESAAGRLQIYASADRRLLEETRIVAEQVEGQRATMASLAFAPDGRTIVSSGVGGGALLHEVALIRLFAGHEGGANAVAYSANGSRIVSGGADHAVHLWQAAGAGDADPAAGAASTQPLATLAGADDAVTSVAVLPDGSGIVAGSLDHAVRLWRVPADDAALAELVAASEEPIQPAAAFAHAEAVRGVNVNRDGSLIAAVGDDQLLRVWDVSSGRELERFSGHQEPVLAAAFGPDGRSVVTGSADQSVRVWTISAELVLVAGTVVPAEEGEASIAGVKDVACLAGRDDDETPRFVTISEDNVARVWNLDGTLALELAAAQSILTSVAADPSGTRIAAGSADNQVYVWSADGDLVMSLSQPALEQPDREEEPAVRRVAFGVDGTKLFVGRADNRVQVYGAEGGRLLEEVTVAAPVSVLAVGGPDDVVVTRGAENAAAVGRLSLLRLVTAQENPINSVAWLGNGQWLAVGGSDPSDPVVRIHHAADGALLATLTPGEWTADADMPNDEVTELGVTTLSVTADGRRLAASIGKRVLMWTIAEPMQTTPVAAFMHSEVVRTARLSADGTRIAACSGENVVRVWDVASGLELERFAGHEDGVLDLAYLPNGESVVSASKDQSLRVWTLSALRMVRASAGPATGVAFVGDGSVFATAGLRADEGEESDEANGEVNGQKNVVSLWPVDRSARLDAEAAEADEANGGQNAAGGGGKNPAALSDADEGPIARLIGADGSLKTLAVNAARTHVAAGGSAGTVFVWQVVRADADAGEDAEIAFVSGDVEPVAQIATPAAIASLAFRSGDMLQDGSVSLERMQLAVGGEDREVRVYAVADGQLRERMTPVEVAPDDEAEATEDAADDGESAELAERVPPQRRRIPDVVLAPDGQRVVMVSGRTPQVHQLSLLKLLRDPEGAVTSVTYTSDGQFVLSGGADGTVRLWSAAVDASADEPANRRPHRQYVAEPLEGRERDVTSVAVIANGTRVIAGSRDHTVREWPFAPDEEAEQPAEDEAEIRSLEPLATYVHGAAVRSVRPSADGARIAAAGDDQVVRVWHVASGLELERFEGHGGPVWGVGFGADNRRVVSGSEDGTVRVWRTSAVAVVEAHPGGVWDAAFVGPPQQLATVGEDGVARLWDAALQPIREFEGSPGPLTSLSVRANGTQLAAAGPPPLPAVDADAADDGSPADVIPRGEDGPSAVYVWNLADANLIRTIETPIRVRSLAFSPDNEKLAAACDDWRLRVYSVDQGAVEGGVLLQEIEETLPIATVRFAPDSRELLLGMLAPDESDEAVGRINTWRYVSPNAVTTFTGHNGGVYGVAFSPDGTMIASASADATVRLWNRAQGNQIRQLTGHEGTVSDVAFSPDGSLLVSAGDDGSIRLWDVVGGRQLKLLQASGEPLYAVDFSPDGKTVAAGGVDLDVHLFDAVTGERLATLDGHSDFIYGLTFNATGERLVSCGYGGRITIWNLRTSEEDDDETADKGFGEAIWRTQPCRVAHHAAYSPDGTRLIVAGGDGFAYFVDIPAEAR